MYTHYRWLSAAALIGALLSVTTAGAQGPSLDAMAKDYAKANKLPIRKVPIKLAGRNVTRLVVPVLTNTVADFGARFSEDSGCMVWRKHNDPTHITLNLGPQRFVSYGNAAGGYCGKINDVANPNMTQQATGVYLALGLGKPRIDGFKRFLTTTGAKGLSVIQKEYQAAGKSVHGGCMWWLLQGEVDKDLNLAHALGVTRSKDPGNLLTKLIHAGNAQVGPLGIGVPDIQTFEKMTDAQLLGNPPQGGAADAVK